MATYKTQIKIGKRYGALKVLSIEHPVYIMLCACGAIIRVAYNRLAAGRARCCDNCSRRAKYIADRTVDRKLLARLRPELARMLLTRWVDHVRSCVRNNCSPAKFKQFADEIINNNELAEAEPIPLAAREFIHERRSFPWYYCKKDDDDGKRAGKENRPDTSDCAGR